MENFKEVYFNDLCKKVDEELKFHGCCSYMSDDEIIRLLNPFGEMKTDAEIRDIRNERLVDLCIKNADHFKVDKEFISDEVIHRLKIRFNDPNTSSADRKAVNKLILENNRALVLRCMIIAMKKASFNHIVLNEDETNDIMANAVLCILDKWVTFDPTRGVRLSNYLWKYVLGTMIDFLKEKINHDAHIVIDEYEDGFMADMCVSRGDVEALVQVDVDLEYAMQSLTDLERFAIHEHMDNGNSNRIISKLIVQNGFKEKCSDSQVSKLLKKAKAKLVAAMSYSNSKNTNEKHDNTD